MQRGARGRRSRRSGGTVIALWLSIIMRGASFIPNCNLLSYLQSAYVMTYVAVAVTVLPDEPVMWCNMQCKDQPNVNVKMCLLSGDSGGGSDSASRDARQLSIIYRSCWETSETMGYFCVKERRDKNAIIIYIAFD